jgi:hypothetical protein
LAKWRPGAAALAVDRTDGGSLAVSQRHVALAVLLSLLLHAGLLSVRYQQRLAALSLPSALQVQLRLLLPVPQAAMNTPKPPLASPMPQSPPPRRVAPRPVTPAEAEAIAAPSTATLPAPLPDAEPLAPAATLRDRALAGLAAADRAQRDADARGPWMVKPKALPPSLVSLPKEAQTLLAKRFDDRLAELVIISQVERQEDNNRITIIETNKGRFCGYEPLVKPHFMEGQATAQLWGTCGPKS